MVRISVLAACGVLLATACARPVVPPPTDRLVAAVRADSLAGVMTLLDHGVDPGGRSGDGALPIVEAIRLGHDTIAAELLRAGADPAVPDTTGLTGYDHAMAAERSDGMDRLILHAAQGAGGGPRVMAWFEAVRSPLGEQPPWQDVLSGELLSLGLMYAALHDRTDLIGAMRRAREVPNRTGYHALAVAARWGREQATWALLGIDTHADLPTGSARHSTALMEAARSGDVAIGRRLLAAGARVDRLDARGESALHWAARHGTMEYAMMLVAAGARRDLRNVDDRIPAAVAALAGHDSLATELAPDRTP